MPYRRRPRDARPCIADYPAKEFEMLETIVVVLVILWLLGIATSYTAGGLIHILLVIAIIVVLLRVIRGRNPL
jgi:predicted ferric reductase